MTKNYVESQDPDASSTPMNDVKTPLITVITPTIGNEHLATALRSVQAQTYRPLEHLVVIDGPASSDAVRQALAATTNDVPIHVLQLPYNVGAGGWNGHRVYGSAPYLCRGEFVAFLDEDNLFSAVDHIDSLAQLVTEQDYSWAYALRRVVAPDGSLICLDQCESLGDLHCSVLGLEDFFVDPSCYLIRRDVAIRIAAAWNKRFRPATGSEPDRDVTRALIRIFPQHGSTKCHSVDYRVSGTSRSVRADFFLRGNELMQKAYPDGLPWARNQDDK